MFNQNKKGYLMTLKILAMNIYSKLTTKNT